MKNKIGIITYHRAINYGAILQTFALHSKLKEIGEKNHILDYRNIKLEKDHAKKNIKELKTPKDLARYFLLYRNYNKKHDKFRSFLDNYLELSEPIFTIEKLKESEKEYTLFITGSDQVWNYKINDKDPAYFLSFVQDKSKKKSYAASFGLGKIPEEYKHQYKNLLNDFDSLLIREKQGVKIIKDLLSRESSVVLDPTMLLSQKQWLTSLGLDKTKSYYLNKKYILVYAFAGETNIKKLAINISMRTGYKILWISTTYKHSVKIKYIKTAGPEEFISLFSNAEYIITNSFHGTAFSINFNKEFFTEMLPESSGVNSRLEDILELFGLQERMITSSDADVIDSRIDYDKVNLRLKEERDKSLSLLYDTISNTEN